MRVDVDLEGHEGEPRVVVHRAHGVVRQMNAGLLHDIAELLEQIAEQRFVVNGGQLDVRDVTGSLADGLLELVVLLGVIGIGEYSEHHRLEAAPVSLLGGAAIVQQQVQHRRLVGRQLVANRREALAQCVTAAQSCLGRPGRKQGHFNSSL